MAALRGGGGGGRGRNFPVRMAGLLLRVVEAFSNPAVDCQIYQVRPKFYTAS
jgi:hypothetical protein